MAAPLLIEIDDDAPTVPAPVPTAPLAVPAAAAPASAHASAHAHAPAAGPGPGEPVFVAVWRARAHVLHVMASTASGVREFCPGDMGFLPPDCTIHWQPSAGRELGVYRNNMQRKDTFLVPTHFVVRTTADNPRLRVIRVVYGVHRTFMLGTIQGVKYPCVRTNTTWSAVNTHPESDAVAHSWRQYRSLSSDRDERAPYVPTEFLELGWRAFHTQLNATATAAATEAAAAATAAVATAAVAAATAAVAAATGGGSSGGASARGGAGVAVAPPPAYIARLVVEAAVRRGTDCAITLTSLAEGDAFLVPGCGHVCLYDEATARLTRCPTCREAVEWARVNRADLQL